MTKEYGSLEAQAVLPHALNEDKFFRLYGRIRRGSLNQQHAQKLANPATPVQSLKTDLNLHLPASVAGKPLTVTQDREDTRGSPSPTSTKVLKNTAGGSGTRQRGLFRLFRR